MSDRPDWDNQFAESETRVARRTIVRDADPTKTGMFVFHTCWKCGDGERPCIAGNPRQCEYPHARND